MGDIDIVRLTERMDAADRRMQHLQEQIDILKANDTRRLESIVDLRDEMEKLLKRLDAIAEAAKETP